MGTAVSPRPVTLTVAGSDNSAGAGIQADLKTFSHFGCYGLTAVTCVVAEVPGRVTAIQPISPSIVAEQIALCLEAFPVRAIKTGMLFSTPIINAVTEAFSVLRDRPLVIDPVMIASSGHPLLKPSAIAAYRKKLFPLAALVTPNLDELRLLSRREVRSFAEMKEAGRRLVDQFGCAFLLKGGHLPGKYAIDYLATPDGMEEFAAPFIEGIDPHGTGCTYSAAIAANLARGLSLHAAVFESKAYITAAIAESQSWGETQALEHFPKQAAAEEA